MASNDFQVLKVGSTIDRWVTDSYTGTAKLITVKIEEDNKLSFWIDGIKAKLVPNDHRTCNCM